MAQTEAACLLQSGAMYPRRVGLRTGSGDDLFAGIKRGGFSLYFGDAPIFHFDFEGRWHRAFVDGVHYLKGLDATVRSIDREREGRSMVLRRRALQPPEATAIDVSVRAVTVELIEALDSGRINFLPPPPSARSIAPEELRGLLGNVISWDAAAWSAHSERYLVTYGPWPFLPPDALNAVVLQATVGHEGGVAFGGARPSPHRVRSPVEFEEHVRAVAWLLGRRVEQCRDVFLGGADVLRRPVDSILENLETIGRIFPIAEDRVGPGGEALRLGTVHAFLDDFRPPLPDPEDWSRLQANRLGRVTLGIESGLPEVRAEYGKSWEDQALRATVAGIKGAKIAVGVVVLAGSGGGSMARNPLGAMVDLVDSMGLGASDLVSVVDAATLGASTGGSSPTAADDLTGMVAALKGRLADGRASKGPRVVSYNPDKQWT